MSRILICYQLSIQSQNKNTFVKSYIWEKEKKSGSSFPKNHGEVRPERDAHMPLL